MTTRLSPSHTLNRASGGCINARKTIISFFVLLQLAPGGKLPLTTGRAADWGARRGAGARQEDGPGRVEASLAWRLCGSRALLLAALGSPCPALLRQPRGLPPCPAVLEEPQVAEARALQQHRSARSAAPRATGLHRPTGRGRVGRPWVTLVGAAEGVSRALAWLPLQAFDASRRGTRLRPAAQPPALTHSFALRPPDPGAPG